MAVVEMQRVWLRVDIVGIAANVVKEENIRTLIHIVGTDLFYLERISSAFTTAGRARGSRPKLDRSYVEFCGWVLSLQIACSDGPKMTLSLV